MSFKINAFDAFRIISGIVLLLFLFNWLKTGNTDIGANLITTFFKFISDIVSSILTPVLESLFNRTL